ncbi:zinc-dependent alcohol dehydrogenase [Cerasicoccus maritimus]|uniref:zinc-dependent alcohol dehydrogenase n=1 Tax=Cerasicoccus maritimus TaxID=490089 RepID=UPI002852B6AC|nr:zinc-binding alcohol dehydrogenase [Cerasicoccus maritimus]
MSYPTKTVQFVAQGEVELVSSELGEPNANEVIVKNDWSLISAGTELTCLHRRFAAGTHWDDWLKYPHTPGYSAAGRIIAVGSEAAKEWSVGDRVAARIAHASHVCVNAESLYRLPDGLDASLAAWVGLLKIVQVGARTADPELGSKVVIVGCGILGQLAVQYMAHAGCETIIAIDTNQSRLDTAQANGATHVIASGIGESGEAVLQACYGEAPDIVIDVTGSSAVLPHCLAMVRDFGKVVLLGDPGDPNGQHITKDIILRGVRLLGAHDNHPALAFAPRNNWTPDRMINYGLRLLANGKLDVARLTSHRFPATEAKEAYAMASDPSQDNLGILLDWSHV